jgi:peptidoglycan-N-acetylglucosamine deacetylase
MPAADASTSRERRELRRRQVRRRRLTAVLVLAALVAAPLLALAASGGERVEATARAGPREPLLPAAVQRAQVRRLARLGRPVYCAGRRRPYVALTFDDGPGRGTPAVLRALEAAGAPGTFFLLGRNVAPFRSLLPLEARAGAIGDGTFDDTPLTQLSLLDGADQISRTAKAITAVTDAPVRLVRPPAGARNPAIDSVARAEEMLAVLWDVDTHDVEGADAPAIVAAVRRGAKPGSIVLMHDNEPQALAALPGVLAELQRKRLEPVTVPELVALDPPSPAQLDAGPRGCGLPDPNAEGGA